MSTLYSLQGRREIGNLPDEVYWRATRDSQNLIQRLKVTKKLEGHQGCVNTVSWNCSGSRLLSGSDDHQLKIYDTKTRTELTSLVTAHQSNIFSAKFLPGGWYGDMRTVSCAGTGSVEYSEVTPTGRSLNNMFKCHRSITYQVAVTPNDGNEFLTCEEKGYVRLYDLRVKTQCSCNGCTKDVLYSFPTSVSSIAIHPLSPYYIAVGLGDGSLRVLDRRMAGIWRQPLQGAFRVHPQPVHKYSSGSLARKITCVQFNQDGSQLLASYSEDVVYLFNSGIYGCGGGGWDGASIPEPAYLSRFTHYSPSGHSNRMVLRKAVPSDTLCRDRMESDVTSVPSLGTANASRPNTPPPKNQAVKKIRFRGDWSDTGPEARPNVDGTWPDGNPLINHMSRLFADWMGGSLNSDGGDVEREENTREVRMMRWRRWSEERRRTRQANVEGGGETPRTPEVGEAGKNMDSNKPPDVSLSSLVVSEQAVESCDACASNPGRVAASQGRIAAANINLKESASESRCFGVSRDTSNDSKVVGWMSQSCGESTKNELTAAHSGNPLKEREVYGMACCSSEHITPATDASELDPLHMVTSTPQDDSKESSSKCSVDLNSKSGGGGDRGGGGGSGRGGCDRGVGDGGDRRSDGSGIGAKGEKYNGDVGIGGGDGGSGDVGIGGGSDGSGDVGIGGGDGGGDVGIGGGSDGGSGDVGIGGGGDGSGDVGIGGGDVGIGGGSDGSGDVGIGGGSDGSGDVGIGGGGDGSGDVGIGGGDGGGDVGIGGGDGGGERSSMLDEARPFNSKPRDIPVKTDDEIDGCDLYRPHHHCPGDESASSSSRSCDKGERSYHQRTKERKIGVAQDAEATIRPFMTYKGHRNARTMIKQANFFGENWVLSGSDCGRMFVWDKWTGEVVNLLLADSHVVNCIQPHPSAYVIATSGVDYDIKLWEPVDDQACSLDDVSKVMECNRIMLEESRNTITMPPLMFIRVLPYLNRRRRMRGGAGVGRGGGPDTAI